MELADLVARELYEWVYSGCQSNSDLWQCLSRKIYVRDSGLRGTFGVKVFPDYDVREHILMHRRKTMEN